MISPDHQQTIKELIFKCGRRVDAATEDIVKRTLLYRFCESFQKVLLEMPKTDRDAILDCMRWSCETFDQLGLPASKVEAEVHLEDIQKSATIDKLEVQYIGEDPPISDLELVIPPRVKKQMEELGLSEEALRKMFEQQ